jgi:DNA-binding transcriptional LysR family regulator
MDDRLIEAFVAVSASPSFSAAARRLAITQPALTKRIQLLEAQVGAPLFVRGRNGASLSPTGAALIDDAKEIGRLMDKFDHRVRGVASGEEGYLRVGFGLSSIAVAPQAVAAYRAKYPQVAVRLEDMSSSAQFEMLASGELDVAFARLPAPGALHSVPLLSDRLTLAHPAAWPGPTEVSDLATWLSSRSMIRLATARGPGLARQTDEFLAQSGLTLRTAHEANDLQTVLALVAAGVGVAVVPASASNIAPDAVTMIALTGDGASWQIGAVWTHQNETPIVRRFLAELDVARRNST